MSDGTALIWLFLSWRPKELDRFNRVPILVAIWKICAKYVTSYAGNFELDWLAQEATFAFKHRNPSAI